MTQGFGFAIGPALGAGLFEVSARNVNFDFHLVCNSKMKGKHIIFMPEQLSGDYYRLLFNNRVYITFYRKQRVSKM